MRVGPDHVCMHKRRSLPRTTVVHSTLHRRVAHHRIGAIDFLKMEIRETGNQAGDVAPGRLYFYRNRNRVLVVLDHEDNGQLPVGSGVERLPEFPFAGGAIAERDVGDLVAPEADILKLAVIPARLLGGIGMIAQIDSGFRASDRLQNLGARWRRLSNDVESPVSPVRRHLPATGTGIIGRAHGLEQHLVGSSPQGKHQRPVTVIRIEPVVRWPEAEGGSDADRFMPSPGNLKENLLLPLEQDLAIVHPPRGVHNPVSINELLAGKSLVGLRLPLFSRQRAQLGVGLRSRHSVPVGWGMCRLHCNCREEVGEYRVCGGVQPRALSYRYVVFWEIDVWARSFAARAMLSPIRRQPGTCVLSDASARGKSCLPRQEMQLSP